MRARLVPFNPRRLDKTELACEANDKRLPTARHSIYFCFLTISRQAAHRPLHEQSSSYKNPRNPASD